MTADNLPTDADETSVADAAAEPDEMADPDEAADPTEATEATGPTEAIEPDGTGEPDEAANPTKATEAAGSTEAALDEVGGPGEPVLDEPPERPRPERMATAINSPEEMAKALAGLTGSSLAQGAAPGGGAPGGGAPADGAAPTSDSAPVSDSAVGAAADPPGGGSGAPTVHGAERSGAHEADAGRTAPGDASAGGAEVEGRRAGGGSPGGGGAGVESRTASAGAGGAGGGDTGAESRSASAGGGGASGGGSGAGGGRPSGGVGACLELLTPLGVPGELAEAAARRLGEGAAARLREDPWLLLALPEIKPEQADYVARRLLGDRARPNDPRRGRALVGHLLARAARDGHTAVPARRVGSALAGLGLADPTAALGAALDSGFVNAYDSTPGEATAAETNGPDADGAPADHAGPDGAGPDGAAGEPVPLLATARIGDAEDALGAGLARLAGSAEPPGDPEAANAALDGLDGPVRELALAVLAKGVAVAGHDSDDALAALVTALTAILDEQGLETVLTAPTAPAARTLGALTGMPAVPLHDLLEPQAGAGPYARGEDWPVEADLIVVGSAELLDVHSAAALVTACADGARLLLAGDPAALPAAGPGRVFADAAACLPHAHLPTPPGNPRSAAGKAPGAPDNAPGQAGNASRGAGDAPGQADNAAGAAGTTPGPLRALVAAVREGSLPAAEDPERSVVVVPVRDAAEAAHRAVQLVTDSIPRALGIPAGEVQVVTPVRRGEAGTTALNEALKARLNPGPGAYGGFDPGDRVVVATDRSRYGLPAGDTGEVVKADTDGLVVRFPGPDGAIELPVPAAGLDELRHGWAITVHRAHGGRWPAAVAVLPGDVAGSLSRPLVYTAFTRAERHLSVVHGAGATLAQAVRSVPAPTRRTRLTELLQGELAAFATDEA